MKPGPAKLPQYVALAAALFGSTFALAASDAAREAVPTPPNAQATAPSDTSAEGDVQAPRIPRRWDVRMRLDDGRYRGFHQAGGDDPTRDDIGRAESTRDRVYGENNQIRADHRARGRDLYP
jgi:hypothetical protein